MSQTVDRALQILEFLGEGERDLAEVADLLEVHKSTALRLLQTLEARNFVRHNAAHRYRLGVRMFSLSTLALGSLDIRSIAAPHLRRLADQTQQTIHLGAYDGSDVFYIDKFETQKTVRMYSRIGVPAPLYCTGVAKAIVAEQPIQDRIRIAEGIDYVRHTERTITTPQGFLDELNRVRQRGYAIDDREHEDYIHCIAVALRPDSAPVTHGISLSAPTITINRAELLELVPMLQDVATKISAEIA
ncbi:IclR family transcriptional regulator [Agromyces aerolatus]|uniref:IclR family transcriptional regulator n=1 Tax=Agromyces sp. LY-1074 TaxID=3074080 RepID=UPI0028587A38|nr:MULTISPECIES: IclR family transcriptional regulator [unclassified Agromyces]MDR5699552.1 IclR family transcriptional regulator [Agromyces sp. LY-1074]MDR5705848.1 IclR family transcriptional regulator [Agromyces sp. LY-1358]